MENMSDRPLLPPCGCKHSSLLFISLRTAMTAVRRELSTMRVHWSLCTTENQNILQVVLIMDFISFSAGIKSLSTRVSSALYFSRPDYVNAFNGFTALLLIHEYSHFLFSFFRLKFPHTVTDSCFVMTSDILVERLIHLMMD